MPLTDFEHILNKRLDKLHHDGRLKGAETVFTSVIKPVNGKGPRFLVEGQNDKPFVRMNSNSYLGLSLHQSVIQAAEEATEHFGSGPGAVRFISGTWSPHVQLENTLASFHLREAAMIFSSAYATVLGVLPQFVDEQTLVLTDALNHNCIINALKLNKPAIKHIYPHADLDSLEKSLSDNLADSKRAVIVTDGIFSMRGDHAPLNDIMQLAKHYDASFKEGVIVIVDDSHGVGAFGTTGRGTEEHVDSPPAHLLIGTLGKAFGVNGGYVTGGRLMIDYLRETSPLYIYSNPITPGEAAAATKSVAMVDSDRGAALLTRLHERTARLRTGLRALGMETISGDHPIVPLMTRDTNKTRQLVSYLYDHGVLATGLHYPVVPQGDDKIRFQVCADHTPDDIDQVLDLLSRFK